MRIIDLSAPIAPSPPDAAPFERVELKYTSHAEGAAQAQAMLCVPPHLLRNGEGWAVEEFTRLGTHSVTHVDAPWHYNSQIQGRQAATIDELPLEWFFADGVVLDMTAKADGERIRGAGRRGRAGGDGLRAPAVGHRAGADGAGRLLRPARLRAAGLRRDARGDPLDVRAGRPGHGDRRLGLGRAAGPAGRGGAGEAAAGGLLGRPPVGPALLADRAAG